MPNQFQSGSPIAPGRGNASRKLPTPFSRPRIEIGGGKQEKKDWQWLNAFELEEGFVVAGEGVVQEIRTQFQEGAEWRMYLRTPRNEHGTIVDAFKKYYTFAPVKSDKTEE